MEEKKVSFVVYGEPQGKQRPRFSRASRVVRTYTPQKTVSYENEIRQAYAAQCKNFRFEDGTPLCNIVHAFYKIPKSASKKKREEMLSGIILPCKKPDYDNIAKIVSDSLNGIAYKDDAQIVLGVVEKLFSDEPKIIVEISNLRQMLDI